MSRPLLLLAFAILLVAAPLGRAIACEGSEIIFEDKFAAGAGLLCWGEDNRTYFQFGVLNNGKFWIARKIDGKWHTIAENIDASAINTTAGASNTLRVKVSGNAVTFFVNGTK